MDKDYLEAWSEVKEFLAEASDSVDDDGDMDEQAELIEEALLRLDELENR